MYAEHALSAQDTAVVCAYLASVLVIGGALAMVRLRSVGGAQTPEQYFLGGRSLPWWALAVADLSSYLDISGTMINTALLYALGMQGFYVEIRGGVCLMLAFQLAFTGKLSRRSMMITKAEWMRFRFGDDRGGRAARFATAIVAVVNALLMVCYFAIGGGKFATTFINVPSFLGIGGEFWAAACLMLIAAVYTVAAGFWSIVWTDVYQSIFIFFAFVYVGVRGIFEAPQLPAQLVVHVPLRNGSFVPVQYTRDRWLSVWPSARLGGTLPSDANYAIYDIYWLAIAFYVLKTSVQSLGGPSGGGLQTVLAQRSDVAVARQTLLAACLMALRWLFSAALAVLAASHFGGINVIDPERVLPDALAALPSGFRGLILSALLAAGLTTFDTTINAASSYCTLDIYHTFVHPGASKQRLFGVALASSAAVMLGGLLISLRISTINSVWGSVMMGLGGCQSWPAFLAWYWERTNGLGFAAGIACGLVAFVVQLALAPDWPEYSAFCLSSACSLGATVAVSLRTAPTPTRVLGAFFRRTRPPGAWHGVVQQEVPGGKRSRFMKEVRRENHRDLLSSLLAVPWQMFLYLTMVCVVTRDWTQLAACASVAAVLSVCLYYVWYTRILRQERDSKARGDSALLSTILKRGGGKATDRNARTGPRSGVAAAQSMIDSVDLAKRSEAERWEAYAELDHALYARLLDESPLLRDRMRTSAALEEGEDDDDEDDDEDIGTGTLERERSERARFGWGLLGSWRWSTDGGTEATESRRSSSGRRGRRRRSDWLSGSGSWSFGSTDSGGVSPRPGGSPLLGSQ